MAEGMAAIASSCVVSFFKWNKNQVMVTQAGARKIFKAIFGKSPKTITLQDRAFAQSLADAGINATQHMNFSEFNFEVQHRRRAEWASDGRIVAFPTSQSKEHR